MFNYCSPMKKRLQATDTKNLKMKECLENLTLTRDIEEKCWERTYITNVNGWQNRN